ncbi:serine/arginine repetitive matrix protein 2 isoform X2 [Panicum miliaceum]|uniref:Serine/arginine repetitive matrix protein 2 isoform X2 n=1 Tax=Panicum miliaceum TaxID=4540 RepID=A0A3L6PYG0_PANMI|nr:serine/arginine repetitive matrix protein 2 isoform X2 [Panicum miliaceum]
MDAYHQQRRFAGSGDAPPPPQQPPHLSHPNAHWYPAAPPPYPSHPSHPYPPQHHHHWGPPHDLQQQHQRHPPPPQQQLYGYQQPPPPIAIQQQQQPPPPPGNPWPPHHASGQPPPPNYPPPPSGQAWTNHSWAQNHGYPGQCNEEDWATKAKAWIAAKSVTGNHQIEQHAISTSRTESHHNGYHDQYRQPAGLPTEVTEHLHPPVPQSSNGHMPFPMTGQHRETNHLSDRGPMVSPAQTFGSFPSTYEQEVSYNYSSAPGNGNNMLQYPNSQGQSFPTASTVQGGFPQAAPSMPVVPSAEQPPFGHERQSVDPSDQPLEFNSLKAPDVVVHTNVNSTIPAAPTLASNYDVVTTSTHSWTPSATVGFLPRAPLPPQAAQMDPHAAPLFGAASSSNYAPPAAFGVGSVTEVFPTDPNTPFSVAEKSKKRPVPNWLREELLKKKSAPSNASAHPTNLNSMESHDAEQPLGIPDQSDSRSNDSAKSTEGNEDDEDEIEASRVAAINREIKRVLTEVLLKVTDDLFDEIATKVLNEDDSSAESNEPAGVGSKEPGPREARTKTTAKVLLPAKPTNISSSDHKDSTGLSSPKGALLGLASYDSDDNDDDNDSKDKIPMSDLSANAGVANTEEGDKSTLGKEHMNHDEKKLSRGSTSSGDLKSINKNSQRSTKVEPEREHIHDIQNGEFPVDAKTFIKPNSAVDKMDEKADRYAAVDVQNRKTSSNNHAEKYDDLESSHRHLEKSSKDFVKEVKTDHAKEHESFTAKKYNSDDKYSIHGNVDKKSSFKEGKGSDRTSKHESNRRDSRSNSKHDGAKADRKDFPKDTRERDRDTTDRRGGKGKDEKDDRSRQMTKGSTSHSRNSRSRSPRGRSRSRRENSSHVQGSVSSDEPSDSMKKRYGDSQVSSRESFIPVKTACLPHLQNLETDRYVLRLTSVMLAR